MAPPDIAANLVAPVRGSATFQFSLACSFYSTVHIGRSTSVRSSGQRSLRDGLICHRLTEQTCPHIFHLKYIYTVGFVAIRSPIVQISQLLFPAVSGPAFRRRRGATLVGRRQAEWRACLRAPPSIAHLYVHAIACRVSVALGNMVIWKTIECFLTCKKFQPGVHLLSIL